LYCNNVFLIITYSEIVWKHNEIGKYAYVLTGLIMIFARNVNSLIPMIEEYIHQLLRQLIFIYTENSKARTNEAVRVSVYISR
jgi:short subunit dehydrogenase-like uncharacterized protein